MSSVQPFKTTPLPSHLLGHSLPFCSFRLPFPFLSFLFPSLSCLLPLPFSFPFPSPFPFVLYLLLLSDASPPPYNQKYALDLAALDLRCSLVLFLTFDIKFKTAKPTSTMCTEVVLFANTEISHIQVFFTRGTHTLHFEMSDTESQHDIAFNGLNAFVFCEDAVDTIESIWNTLKMFLGGIGTDPSKL